MPLLGMNGRKSKEETANVDLGHQPELFLQPAATTFVKPKSTPREITSFRKGEKKRKNIGFTSFFVTIIVLHHSKTLFLSFPRRQD